MRKRGGWGMGGAVRDIRSIFHKYAPHTSARRGEQKGRQSRRTCIELSKINQDEKSQRQIRFQEIGLCSLQEVHSFSIRFLFSWTLLHFINSAVSCACLKWLFSTMPSVQSFGNFCEDPVLEIPQLALMPILLKQYHGSVVSPKESGTLNSWVLSNTSTPFTTTFQQSRCKYYRTLFR